jgi:hypothetical protein
VAVMPWWGVALLILGAFILGGLIVYVILVLYFSRAMRH